MKKWVIALVLVGVLAYCLYAQPGPIQPLITNLTQFKNQTNWRLFYSDGNGDVQELALGANTEVLTSNGTTSAPSWGAGGSGDMTKAVYDVSADGFVDGNDVAYAASWNGDVNAPSMNAVYDKIQTLGGGGDLLADGSVPLTANWDVGNFDITLKALTGDGTIEGATLTEGGNAVYNSSETPGGELGGTFASFTIDDSIAVSNWNLTTPTITTSLTTSTPTTLSVAELDRLDGLAGIIVTDVTAVTDIEGTGLSIAAGTLNWSAASTDLTDTADLLYEAELDTFSELDTQIADKALVNKADGAVWSGVHDYGGATTFEIPNAESTDGTLGALGQIHIRGDEDRVSYHVGAGGEVAGEVTKSVLDMIAVSFDPGSWYDSDTQVCLFDVQAKKFPNGIIIDYWEVDCLLDPDVEMNLNLGYANDWDDIADPNLIDVLDTTAGKSSEDTDANINGGTAIAAGSVIFLYFDADPEGTCVQMHFEMIYHSEED